MVTLDPTPEPDDVQIRLDDVEPKVMYVSYSQHFLPCVELPGRRTPPEIWAERHSGGQRVRLTSSWTSLLGISYD